MLQDIGKFLVLGGLLATLAGGILLLTAKFGDPGWLRWIGHLPLDIRVENERFSLYFPFGTSILLSLLLSFVIYLINAFTK